MLLIKDNQKLFEFKDYFNNPTRAISVLIDILAVFTGKSLLKDVFSAKMKGYSYVNMLQMLVLMPFMGAKNVSTLFTTHCHVFYTGQKDCLYETLRNPAINWRLLLIRFAKRFIKKTDMFRAEGADTFFIVDDSDLEKSTPFFEGLSRVFNHVTNSHVFAYKLLVLGYSDGKSFVPFDFSLHNEKGKKKNYGLTAKQRKEQYKKDRKPGCFGAKRKKEVRTEKGKNLIKMVKRAVKHGVVPKYLLTDSWFLCENMINEIRKIKGGAMHVLSMCRMDKRKYSYDQGLFNAGELLKQGKDKVKRSRKHKVYYIELNAEYKGVAVKLFFTRFSKRSKWRLLLTTNTGVSFTRAFELYSNRWAIEVFFKECKQYLGLGKNQSRDFDAQIASTTICFAQYTILALYKRNEKYETIGKLFEGCRSGLGEQIFSDRIRALFLEIVETLIILLELPIDVEETIANLILKVDLDSQIGLIYSTPTNRGGTKIAA